MASVDCSMSLQLIPMYGDVTAPGLFACWHGDDALPSGDEALAQAAELALVAATGDRAAMLALLPDSLPHISWGLLLLWPLLLLLL